MIRFSVIFLICLCTCLVSGCHSSYEPFAIRNRPWAGAYSKAAFYVDEKNFAMGVMSVNIVCEYNNKKERFSNIIRKSESYLNKIDSSFDWKNPENLEAMFPATTAQKKLFRAFLADSGVNEEYSKRKTIICLNPLVVLVTNEPFIILPKTVVVYNDPTFISQEISPGVITSVIKPSSIGPSSTMVVLGSSTKKYRVRDGKSVYMSEVVAVYEPDMMVVERYNPSLFLSNGYSYGTKLKYSPETYWFSPDLRIPATKVNINEDGIARLPVTWGELLLERVGDDWVVQAVER